jgi:hypothetical protein
LCLYSLFHNLVGRFRSDNKRNCSFISVGIRQKLHIWISSGERLNVLAVTTRYRLDGPGFECQWWRDFPYPYPTHPPVKWERGLSRGVKRSERGVNHSAPSRSEVMVVKAIPLPPLHAFTTWYRLTFTFWPVRSTAEAHAIQRNMFPGCDTIQFGRYVLRFRESEAASSSASYSPWR